MKTLRVVLHNNEPQAADATDQTLRQLHPAGAHRLRRDEDGAVVIEEDGCAVVETDADVGFLRFALERQGYVREVVE